MLRNGLPAILLGLAVAWVPAIGAQDEAKPAATKSTTTKKTTDNKKKIDKKKDVEAIGDRDVGSGINLYSIEKEIALGKGIAQDIERQARITGSSSTSTASGRTWCGTPTPRCRLPSSSSTPRK